MTIICLCFYAESFLFVSKHLGYINNFLRRPSKVEQELHVLSEKRKLGILTEEEYIEKRKNLLENISRV